MTKLLAAYGITPDFTMGHSVGEYGALIASGALPFADALEAVSARGRGMTQVAVNDKGLMAAVFAPLEEVERTLKTIDGYVVIANINSEHQTVIGGATEAVKKAIEIFQKAGYEVAVLAGQPRLPHLDCGRGERTAARKSRAPASGIAAYPDRGECDWRVLSNRAERCPPDAGHALQASRCSRAVCERPAYAL